MGLILDTCALLSLAGLAQRKLSASTLELIQAADPLAVSACSLFELALKHKRGALPLKPFTSARSFWAEAIKTYRIEVLPVEAEDFAAAVALPDHHADPFDRVIMAQARRVGHEVVTYDRLFKGYEIATRA